MGVVPVSTLIELCTESTDAKHMIGLIFRNVIIPAGATITDAYIQFTCDDNDSDEGPLPIDIWGIKEDNTSAPFLVDQSFLKDISCLDKD